MNKQKFQVYAEPVFSNILIHPRTGNSSKLSNKSRKKLVKRGQSWHKKPEDLQLKLSMLELPGIKHINQDEYQIRQRPDQLLEKNSLMQTFIHQSNQIIQADKTLRLNKESIHHDQNFFDFTEKTTIHSCLKQRSFKNVQVSVSVPKKDIKQFRLKNITYSPYLKNASDITKLIKLLKPVKGPNQSIKRQINQYNGLNKKNHELVLMRRPNQTFQAKRQVYLQRIGLKSWNKVFVMNSRDVHIREALLKNGWVELNDISDQFFHLKWVYTDTPSDYTTLNNGQLINHFCNNQQLTNKNSLRRNVKNAQLQNQPLIPLTFDLGVSNESKKFIESSNLFQGVKILNLIIKTFKQSQPKTYHRIISNANYFKYFKKKSKSQQLSKKVNCSILDLIDFQNKQKQVQILIENTIKLISYLIETLSKETNISYSFFHSDKNSNKNTNIIMVLNFYQKIQRIETLLRLPEFLKVQLIKLHFHFLHQKTIFKKCYGTQNSWIVKPTGLSRGSGIYIQSDYKKLLSQQNNQHGKIVQKYIQKPFLLKDQRKFDLRQWVLVRKFQPLQVYMFNKLYGRICPEKYIESDFLNNQRHLTNFSLSRDIYKGKNVIASNEQNSSVLFNRIGLRRVPPPSIILEEDLENQINSLKNKTKSWNQIKLEIKRNVIQTLKACSGNIEQNVNCFEVYGFDILLDEELNTFVIEVNLSPACQKRQGLEVYLQEMSKGLVDYVQKWVNVSPNNQKDTSNEKQIWQKLDEQAIQRQLGQINESKIKNQKAIIIQRWVRSKVIGK